MDYRGWLLIGCTAFFALGCQGTRHSLEALENENRRLEDRVYQLEDALSQHCDLLDQMDQENQQLRNKSASNGSSGSRPNGKGSSRRTNGDPTLTPPDVDLGQPATPDLEKAGPAPPFEGPAPKFPQLFPGRGAPAALVSYDAQSLEKLHLASTDVTCVTLDRMQTGKAATAAPHGFVVIVEPRNASGRLVPATGEVALVVMDTSRRGDGARLARWDFTSDQSAACLRSTALGKRLFFHLDWPDAPAENPHLRLFVRFQTADGRSVQSDAPLQLSPDAGSRTELVRAETPPTATEEGQIDPFDHPPAQASTEDTPPPAEVRTPPVVRKSERTAAASRRRPVWTPYR